MLSNSGLNISIWAKAVITTCYLVNRSLSIAIDFKTPFKVWSNKLVNYSMLKVFKCPTYYHVNEGKLEPRVSQNLMRKPKTTALRKSQRQIKAPKRYGFDDIISYAL